MCIIVSENVNKCYKWLVLISLFNVLSILYPTTDYFLLAGTEWGIRAAQDSVNICSFPIIVMFIFETASCFIYGRMKGHHHTYRFSLPRKDTINKL